MLHIQRSAVSQQRENVLVLPLVLHRIIIDHHYLDVKGRADTLSRQPMSLKNWWWLLGGQETQFYRSEQMSTLYSSLEASVTDCLSQSFVLKAYFFQLLKSSRYYKRAYSQAGDWQSGLHWVSAHRWSKENTFSEGKESLMWISFFLRWGGLVV